VFAAANRAFGFIFLAKKPKKDIASIPHANPVNIPNSTAIENSQKQQSESTFESIKLVFFTIFAKK